MTVREAFANGWKVADTKCQRGYVSRKTKALDQTVYTAGGNRRGQLYYLMPNYKSTQYCFRVYLTK